MKLPLRCFFLFGTFLMSSIFVIPAQANRNWLNYAQQAAGIIQQKAAIIRSQRGQQQQQQPSQPDSESSVRGEIRQHEAEHTTAPPPEAPARQSNESSESFHEAHSVPHPVLHDYGTTNSPYPHGGRPAYRTAPVLTPEQLAPTHFSAPHDVVQASAKVPAATRFRVHPTARAVLQSPPPAKNNNPVVPPNLLKTVTNEQPKKTAASAKPAVDTSWCGPVMDRIYKRFKDAG